MEWLSKILTAVVLISILRKSWVVGELTIICGPMYSESKWYNRQARELNCASEDDSSALVWNQNLKWKYYEYTADTPTEFEESSAESSTLDCPLNDEQGCNRQWSISSNWSIVKSINKAMGPVMDRRWEGFNEIECRGDEPWKYVTGVDEKGRIHFSIRGTYDAYLYLCSSENPSNICLWILIGGWQGKQSAIYISAQQGYTPLTFRQHEESVLSSTEWRTFTIKWNEEGRTVSVHDDKQQLLASNITKKIRIDQLYVQSYDVALFRFHLYDYLYANKQGETLQSPEIRVDDSNFCIEMLIGLCAECTMDVVMTDRRRYEYNMGTINSKQTTNEDELPMWQHIRLKTRGNIGLRNIVRVNVITILKQTDRNPFWAFSNVRVCKEDYAVRKSRLIVAQDWTYKRKYFWPEVSCQKLSYHGGMLVKSTSVISSILKRDMPLCDPGKVGPQCAFDCKSINRDEYCRNLAVCTDKQCICAQGWTGENCDTRCNYGTFGYNCGNRCGNCREGSCDGITGTCSTEADCVGNFLPPHCQIKVEVPLLPSVLRVTETSAHVSLDVAQYRHPDVRYSIYIQQGTGARTDCMNINDEIGRDSTVVQSLCNNLKPGTWYEVYGVAEFGKIPKRISGQRGHFTTYCKPSTYFTLEPDERTLTLRIHNDKKEKHECPPKWYRGRFETLGTKDRTDFRMNSFTRVFYNLTPNTEYEVTIIGNISELASVTERTSEAAPSEVYDVSCSRISEREYLLEWKPPKSHNGIIMGYSITVELLELYGCTNRGKIINEIRNATVKYNQLSLNYLHPYAKYRMSVTAFTSKSGPDSAITFNASKLEIPTSVVSNLRLEDNMIKWENPEDCTTISGPFKTVRLIFQGNSSWARNSTLIKETQSQSFALDSVEHLLYGATIYRARVYVIRDFGQAHNDAAFQERYFTTNPKAPPPVRELEIYETNCEEGTVLLRWMPPNRPYHGELETYMLASCTKSSCRNDINIPVTESCRLWENYVCYTVQDATDLTKIKVWAKNKNVRRDRNISTVNIPVKIKVSEAPETLNVTTLENGVVTLEWSHPRTTYSKLKNFVLKVKESSSNLRRNSSQKERNSTQQYWVHEYQKKYSKQLYLRPSTTYEISVAANTSVGVGSWTYYQVSTPSALNLTSDITIHSHSDHMIEIKLPSVAYETVDSIINVIVQGTISCEDFTPVHDDLKSLIKQSSVNAWIAARFPSNEIEKQHFSIGDNTTYKGVRNCPLKPGETYKIFVVISGDKTEVSTSIRVKTDGKPENSNLKWIVVFPILGIVVLLCYYAYRKRAVMLEHYSASPELMQLSLEPTILKYPEAVPCKPKRPIPPEPKLREGSPIPSRSDLNIEEISDSVPEEVEYIQLVRTENFEEYVKSVAITDSLEKQYKALPRGQRKPSDYGKLPQNKKKNRYGDLTAYDETRVILEKLPNDPYSDYINANFIRGYNNEIAYIATQGPKPHTVIDFWRMIWQEDVHTICMLANVIEAGKTKCEQYWPEIRLKKRYGEVVVFNARQEVFADYVLRTFEVTCNQKTRKVEHLHFTAWPDHGVPMYTNSLVSYLKKLQAVSTESGLIVVHCSAGVGRTGTIILCDICLHQAAAEGAMDVLAETEKMRSQRANMVDNYSQYLLVHLVLIEYLRDLQTALPCNDALPSEIQRMKKLLHVQHQRLRDSAWLDNILHPAGKAAVPQRPLSMENRTKNRYPDIAPGEHSKVFLKRYPISQENSDYISAVFVDGVRRKKQYLASQLPLPTTLSDFWRLIAEQSIELIIILQLPDPDDSTCCELVSGEEFNPVPFLNITVTAASDDETFAIQTLQLVDTSEKPTRTQPVTIFMVKGWKFGNNEELPSPATLVELWQTSERISREGPTVALCYDGVTGCGLYLALSFLLEKMSVEGECDVYSAIRAVRRSRPQFVEAQEQMEFLYDAAIKYLECFETYANFQ